jgi:hypothetical protein
MLLRSTILSWLLRPAILSSRTDNPLGGLDPDGIKGGLTHTLLVSSYRSVTKGMSLAPGRQR